ncbi:hypothetical protein OK016_21325 [Vibrio chagasii]|nr:hypothetical protein [Vibrio chagasii]
MTGSTAKEESEKSQKLVLDMLAYGRFDGKRLDSMDPETTA